MPRQFTTPGELDQVRAAGRLASRILRELAQQAAPGITTAHLATEAERLITEADATPVLKGYRFHDERPFAHAACISINDVAMYGCPSPRVLAQADVINIDLALRTNLGWHADVAASIPVGDSPRADRLIAASHAALRAIMHTLAPGVWWSQAAAAAQAAVGDLGLTLLPGPAAHGLSRSLHEPPSLFIATPSEPDVRLAPGMILAIEPLIAEHPTALITDPNHWTLRTVDGSWTAFQEHMIAITTRGPELLTEP